MLSLTLTFPRHHDADVTGQCPPPPTQPTSFMQCCSVKITKNAFFMQSYIKSYSLLVGNPLPFFLKHSYDSGLYQMKFLKCLLHELPFYLSALFIIKSKNFLPTTPNSYAFQSPERAPIGISKRKVLCLLNMHGGMEGTN